ncbi:Ribosomal RNA-processing protein [Dirofilaria immitis]
MSYKEKLENKDSIIPSRQEKVDYSEEVGTLVPRKQHRPWRNKVRKKAAKEAKRRLREEEGNKYNTIISDMQIMQRKKKNRNKKPNYSNCPNENVTKDKQEINDRGKIDSSLFRYINEQLYTMNSAEAMKLFQKEPEAFELYHKGYQKQVRKWPYNPIHIIIQWIRSLKRDSLVIADLGCGNAMIAKTLSHIATVHSFDLVAANDRVTACDMSMVPLYSESVDIVVFCLSLMGTNLNEYLSEANRILKKGGFLKIAEVASRFINVKQFVHAVKKMGFAVFGKMMKDGGYFIILEFIKTGKVIEKRPTGLKLKPCLIFYGKFVVKKLRAKLELSRGTMSAQIFWNMDRKGRRKPILCMIRYCPYLVYSAHKKRD